MGTGPEENGDGHVDSFDESEEILDEDRVVIVDEDGNELPCVVLAVMEHEGEEFALLGRLDQLEPDAGDEVEVFVFRRLDDEEGNEIFASIEDEELYEVVRREFALLMDQTDDEDDELGEDE
jgi:uncharacterized protein YrzB (UPF0473 family)